MGKRNAMEAAYHMHHFAHAQNDLTQGSSIAGLDAKAMAAANKRDAAGAAAGKKEAGTS